MADPKAKDQRASFAAVLASVRPKTDTELADGLDSLIEAVKSTGKAGSIVVRFDVKPLDGGTSAVIVNDKITLKLPERNREGSIAYIGLDNKLQRTDPGAMPLFQDEDDIVSPDDVDTQTGEVRDPKAGA